MHHTMQPEQAKIHGSCAQRTGSRWLEVGLGVLWEFGSASQPGKKELVQDVQVPGPRGLWSQGAEQHPLGPCVCSPILHSSLPHSLLQMS